MCEQLLSCVASTSIWEKFWKINFQWNLLFSWQGKTSQYKPVWFLTIWFMWKPVETHKIFSSFDCNLSLEVCSIFLDISKAFDKAWHEGLLYKLKSFGISRVLLNGQYSKWQPVLAGVAYGSILRPLFFKYILIMTYLMDWNLILNYLQVMFLYS